MIRAELGAGNRQQALHLLERLTARSASSLCVACPIINGLLDNTQKQYTIELAG